MKTPRERLAVIGCAVVAASLIGFATYLAVTTPVARLGFVALLAAIPITIAAKRWRLARAVRAFRRSHAPRDLLLVYSASPHWQEYIEQQWITRWATRTVVLNRSTPDWQDRPEARLWRRLVGRKEHTPVAIVVPALGRPRVFRFYRAFQDRKHGKGAALAELEAALAEALGP